jgi:predicted RNase H-like nuclease (RuvC/YqgF family)
MDSGLFGFIALLALGVSIFGMVTMSEAQKKQRELAEKVESLQFELATSLSSQDSEVHALKDQLAYTAQSLKVIQSSQTRKLDTFDGEVDYLSKSTNELRTEVSSISDKKPATKKVKKEESGWCLILRNTTFADGPFFASPFSILTYLNRYKLSF